MENNNEIDFLFFIFVIKKEIKLIISFTVIIIVVSIILAFMIKPSYISGFIIRASTINDVSLRKNIPNFIYEVKITGDFMKVTNPIHIGSLGTFDQYLEYGEYSDENDAFDYYKEIQLEVREEIINAGYDGAYDNNQVAIYFPEKNIISIKLLK